MKIKGVNLPGPAVPNTEEDRFPSHFARYGKGGWRTVEDYEDRDLIPFERLELHMIVITAIDGKKWELTEIPEEGEALSELNWKEFTSANIDVIDGGTF